MSSPCVSPPARRARPGLTDLGPVAQLRAGRLGRRLVQLYAGLVLYGASLAMMVRGELGLAPWDVLHSGLAARSPLTLGQVLIVVSFLVLLLWIPLREVPGLGTISNAVVVGLAADAVLGVLVTPDALWLRAVLMVGGVALNAVATALYIGSQLGRGPRDGLMTGLHRTTGRSLRLVRTGLEVAVVALGLLLGGVAGLGTLLYALAIGPLAQLVLPWVTVELRDGAGAPRDLSAGWRSASRRRRRPSPRRW
jgi:uncharacterized membrane protein YczE